MDMKTMRKTDRKILGFLQRERATAKKKDDVYAMAILNCLINDIKMYGYHDKIGLEVQMAIALDERDFKKYDFWKDLQKRIQTIQEQGA